MEIIIAGAGRVGFNLARTLSIGHSVTVIDRNADALHRLQESLDILPVHGDIEDPLTYRKLVDREADLFIAVTDLDEANIISTLIVDDTIDVQRKIIRLRNEFFNKSSIREKLSIDDAVFPLQLTSETVATLLEYPRANNVKSFQLTPFKLISVKAVSMARPRLLHSEAFRLIGIERGKTFTVPSGPTEVEPGDLVYLFGDESAIRKICPDLDTQAPLQIERCVVFGAGDLGISIGRRLLDEGKEVKLLDKDVQRCEIADEALGGEAMAISCKYGTGEIFEEEGLGEADLMIAATDNDEYNIIKCLEAKEHGIRKVVAVNNEAEYYNLMHDLGIVVVRGPKMSAYNAILESIYSSQVVMERKFCGGRGTVYLRKIFEDSGLVGKKIKPLKKENVRLLLERGGRLLDFAEPVTMEAEDLIVGFATEAMAPKLKVWFYGL